MLISTARTAHRCSEHLTLSGRPSSDQTAVLGAERKEKLGNC